jgi:hypothetical protein
MDRHERIAKYLERGGPYAGGALTLIVLLIWHDQLSALFAGTGMDGKDTVDAVFDILVTLTAFLFSVFVLAIAPGGGFIERIFGTTTFRIFKRYVVEALLLGALGALAAVPFKSTDLGNGVWNWTILESLLISLNVCAALAFLRVVHIFIHWMKYDASHRAARRA